MLERENVVVSAENREQKRDIDKLNASIETLRQQLKSEQEKFRTESDLAAVHYRNLEERSRLAEKESSSRIQELTRMNRDL